MGGPPSHIFGRLSNGRAEVAVKKAKRTLMDNIGPTGSLDNDGLLRAMLQLRNTPDPDCNVSPAEVIFGRPIRDAFSFVNRCTKFENPSIRPMWREAWSAKENAMRARFARTSEALNAHSRALPPLVIGTRVYVQNQRGPHPNKWDRSGVVVDVGDNEQYLVKIDGSGRLTLRNRRFLRQFVQPSTSIGEPLSSRCPASNDLALQPRPYTMTATTPDQYHAATAPELHPPATPASPTVSKPQAATMPSSPAAAAPEIHPATATPDVDAPPATFDGPPSSLPRTPSARPPEQSSPRVLRAPRLRRPPRRYDPVSGTWV